VADALAAVRRFLAPYAQVPEGELRRLVRLLKDRVLEKGEFFGKAGERPSEFALVVSGLLRKFYVTQDGRQMTRGFAMAGELVGPYAALLTHTESKLAVQALETSRVIAVQFAAFEALYEHHACWNTLGRRVAEQMFVEREQRESDFLTLTPEQRYEKFLLERPDIAQRVPQYQVASYIGITPVSLSRLRARRQRRRNPSAI
jgi:CRP-like cAMP-binding protein